MKKKNYSVSNAMRALMVRLRGIWPKCTSLKKDSNVLEQKKKILMIKDKLIIYGDAVTIIKHSPKHDRTYTLLWNHDSFNSRLSHLDSTNRALLDSWFATYPEFVMGTNNNSNGYIFRAAINPIISGYARNLLIDILITVAPSSWIQETLSGIPRFIVRQNLINKIDTDKSEFHIKRPFNVKVFPKLLSLGINNVVSLTNSTFSNRTEGQVLNITDTGYINPDNGIPVFTHKEVFDLYFEGLKERFEIIND